MNSMTGPRNMSTGSQRSRPNFRGDVIPKGYRTGQLQQYTPEQLDLYQQQFGYLSPDSDIARMASGDQSYFEQMEAPALRQFSGVIGGIANRFASGSGKGSLGNLRSSGFQNTGTAAASNFSQELMANRQALQRQALMDMMGLSNTLLNQRPYERFMEQKPQKQEGSGWGSIAGGILGGIGGSFFGNPILGAQLGSTAGSYF